MFSSIGAFKYNRDGIFVLYLLGGGPLFEVDGRLVFGGKGFLSVYHIRRRDKKLCALGSKSPWEFEREKKHGRMSVS